MSTSYVVLKMNHRFFLALTLAVVVSLVSCEKDPVFNDPEIVAVEVPKVTEIIDEIILNQKYFTEDSIKSFGFEGNVIFGQDTLKFNLLNNLGIGRDNSGYDKLNILKISQVDPKLDPIVKYTIDEHFSKKIIISWDNQRNKQIADSITTHDPRYSLLHEDYTPISWEKTFDTIINIEIIVLNRFGKVELDIENPNMNNFLVYKSSKYNGQNKDSINLLPKNFYDIYGNEYAYSLTLGNLAQFSMYIREIDYTIDKKYEIMYEAQALIKKSLSENLSWDIIKQSSTFFKHSVVSGTMHRYFGGNGSIFLEDFMGINQRFDFYRAARFSVLGSEYKPYSTIYPKYDFLK